MQRWRPATRRHRGEPQRLLHRNFGGDGDRLELAGQRPSSPAVATSFVGLHLGLFGDLQRVVDFDPEIADGTLESMSLSTDSTISRADYVRRSASVRIRRGRRDRT